MKTTTRQSPFARAYAGIALAQKNKTGKSQAGSNQIKLSRILAFTLACFSSVANAAGLDNAGFEDADLEQQPTIWTVDASANTVIVVDSEDGSEFDVYGPAGANLTVAPYRGDATPPDQMLRIGTPESPGDQNNNQNDGSTAVSQTFEATSTQLALSTRVFTTEFRNNRDAISFQLVGSEGENFPIAGANGIDSFSVGIGGSCTETPCTFPLDAGKNGQIFAGEWTEYRISGLTPGNSYTLRYELITGGGSSHPSWAYFDDVNQPPVAAFSCNPTVAYEGDFIGCDSSESIDPDNDPMTFTWTIESTDNLPEPISLGGPVAGFYAPQDGNYDITLTVSDGSSSSTATVPTAVVSAPPLVSAINVETLGEATLRCRGVDVGAADTHSVSFAISGNIGPVIIKEENDPAYATFAATAGFNTTATGPTSIAGVCRVDEISGGDLNGQANFRVEVLSPEDLEDRYEPNNSSKPTIVGGDAVPVPVLEAGWTRLARLENADDVDFYELRIDPSQIPPTGTEFLVRLKMPADYDALLLSRPVCPDGQSQCSSVFESAPFVSLGFPYVSFPFVSLPFVSLPFVSLPGQTAPFVSLPAQTAPFVSLPFVSLPFVSLPIRVSPFVSLAFQVSDFPLSQMADAPSGNDASGDGVALGELGSLNLSAFENENLRVKDLSANFDSDETLFGIKTADEEAIFLAVLSFDGVLSPDAYEVTVEASVPLDATEIDRDPTTAGTQSGTEVLLGGNCSDDPPLVPVGESSSQLEVIRTGGTPSTLIVTQRQRLQQLEGLSSTEFYDLLNPAPGTGIDAWLTSVGARVISVPSDIFDPWDTQPCRIEPLRTLADQLGATIRAQLAGNPSINNVIILGDFDTLPSDIKADFTSVGYEGLFAGDLPVRPDSSLAAVFRAGHFLTDACFTDTDPLDFNGGLFCVEDIPTGRITTTERLLQEVESFVATGGVINYASGLVTGYEFFKDVATSMSTDLAKLQSSDSVVTLINEFWDSDGLNGLEANWCDVPGLGVAAVQGHASFNAILAPKGYNSIPRDFTDITTVEECFDTGAGSLVATIGCHTVTPVPASALPDQKFFTSDPSLTWTDRRGTWIGSYGFGLGHTDTDELGTEGVLKRFIECIGANTGLTVGQCLVTAKQDYLQSRTSIDAYDIKAVMTLALFGIPQVAVVPAAAETQALLQALAAEDQTIPGDPAGTLILDADDTEVPTSGPYNLTRVNTDNGSFFTVGGDYQAGTGRPFLPTLQVFSRTVPGGSIPARSMSLRSGDYELLTEFDPLISNLRTEWVEAASNTESNACVGTMAPTEIGVFSLLSIGGQIRETFNLTTAQFECTLAPEDRGLSDTVGNTRKFENLTVEVRRPPSSLLADDLNPPDVTRRDIIANATTGDALAIVDAEDENDISEINVLVYDEDRVNGGPGTVSSYSTGNILGQDGPFEVMLPGGAGKFIAIEYFDGANNKILKSGKGILVEAVEVVIRASTYTVGQETLIRVEIERLEEFLNQGITLTIDFDGVTQVFALGPDLLCSNTLTTDCITILPDGSGVFETSYLFNGTTGTVTVSATVRGAASGYDEAVLGRCEDDLNDQDEPNANLAQCGFSASGTNVDIDLYVVGEISDDFKYRVRLLGAQFQYAKGKLSRPSGVQGSVTPLGDNGLRFSFDAGDLGWNGVTPLEIEESTQDGIKGGSGQGTTDVNTFTVSGGAPGV